ncbi:UPF0149 family protein [Litoribacillus peritrichatus]|uniref:UPF0149 family protein n=1 Tax=Litoribacillus peritrichatus TaxID=718191 RepID=A0ABP7NH82_9GAMM
MTNQEQPKDDFEQLFEEMADVFLDLKIHQEPSEVHGVLVGMLVRTQSKGLDEWIGLLEMIDLDTSVLDENAKGVMQNVYLKTRDGLQSDDYNFQLLMPADDYDLGERANALAVWCSGFITGFGMASEHKVSLDNELVELLNHLHSISQLDDQLSESEDNEKDLYELYEYVRLGALMLLQANKDETTQASPDTKKTIH